MCAPGDSGQTFSFVDERGKREKGEREKDAGRRDGNGESACIYVIMDPTEKSEMSRRDASTKDGHVIIYGYTCMRKKRERERK